MFALSVIMFTVKHSTDISLSSLQSLWRARTRDVCLTSENSSLRSEMERAWASPPELRGPSWRWRRKRSHSSLWSQSRISCYYHPLMQIALWSTVVCWSCTLLETATYCHLLVKMKTANKRVLLIHSTTIIVTWWRLFVFVFSGIGWNADHTGYLYSYHWHSI